MAKLAKVISGGQTGVDQAALRAAQSCGLEVGGWCPPGRACESGVIPSGFPLQETEQDRSPDAPDMPRSQRTEWNVLDSDATLVVAQRGASHALLPGFGVASSESVTEDPGTTWTIECAKRYGRPLLVCDVNDSKVKEKIQQWLNESQSKTLNVAGLSESDSPGIGQKAYALVKSVLTANGR